MTLPEPILRWCRTWRHRCTICGYRLDVPGEPWSMDCGGDCLLCAYLAGDPIDRYRLHCPDPVAEWRRRWRR